MITSKLIISFLLFSLTEIALTLKQPFNSKKFKGNDCKTRIIIINYSKVVLELLVTKL